MESTLTERPLIFDYLDYRAFLQDMFLHRKGKDRFFSYRYFARKAQFAAPNFLQLVITGQRNLSQSSIPKLARGFELKKQEREYLEYLVYMNQATGHEERNHYYQKMMAAKGSGPATRLEKASYEYFSKWYCPVVREVAIWGDGRLSAERIGSMLSPPITRVEAEKALKLLSTLGLLEKDPEGRWRQCEAAVTTGPEVRSLVIANYHREMIRLAGESLERHEGDKRDISSLTLSVSNECMPELKKRIAAFRREMLAWACREQSPDQVVQINIQAFPLTGEPEEK